MVSDVTPCHTLSPGVPSDWKILKSWSISELPRNKTSRLLNQTKTHESVVVVPYSSSSGGSSSGGGGGVREAQRLERMP